MDRAFADLVFSGGLPFSFVNNPALRKFIKAVQNHPGEYKPPPYNTLRSSLLNDAKMRVDEDPGIFQQPAREDRQSLLRVERARMCSEFFVQVAGAG